ncbi:MAG: hypothetical protein R2880_01910 [Deinococcales bacterium]
MMAFMERRYSFVCLVVIMLCCTGFAQTDFESRIVQLEMLVAELQQKVALLEAQLNANNAVSPVVQPVISTELANWRKLRMGMSPEEVEQILGQPFRVEAEQVYVNWYYDPDDRYNATVEFDVHYSNKSLSLQGWQEPK